MTPVILVLAATTYNYSVCHHTICPLTPVISLLAIEYEYAVCHHTARPPMILTFLFPH